jgi:hypothetical protein
MVMAQITSDGGIPVEMVVWVGVGIGSLDNVMRPKMHWHIIKKY